VWVKIQGHPCWRVQSALDAQGIEYQIVKGPLSKGKRNDLERLSGQRQYPVIEFEDGTVYRDESKNMRARILAGGLGGAGAEAHGHTHEHDHDHEHGEGQEHSH
jgi:glutaredoxin